MKYKLMNIQDAEDGKHKLKATFYNNETGRQKNIKFGAFGMNDYTIYYKISPEEANKRKRLYLLRHSGMGEDWEKISKGALSRWILWNKPTIKESIKDLIKRFNL